MEHSLKFGIITIQNTSWETTKRRWQQIEEYGFDSLWIADHFVNPREPMTDWLEAWTLLAALATETSRIRIGTLVTPALMRHPAMLARQAMTVDHISNGRLNLGLGSGTAHDPSFPMLGMTELSPGELVGRFREAVEIIDGVLRGETTTYQGLYYQVKEASMLPGPVQKPRPPLTLAAVGPQMLKITARYADTWNTFVGSAASLAEAVASARERNQMLDEFCTQIGRDPQEISRSILLFGRSLTVSPFSSVEVFEEITGSYREAGFNEFIFYYPPTEWYPASEGDQEAVFGRVVEEVIPRLQAKC